MLEGIRIVDLSEDSRRDEFDCGIEQLNTFLKRYARQNQEIHIARSFAAVDLNNRVVGYYSLASASVAFQSLPEHATKGLPKYPIPAVRLARLAVDRGHQGKGLGETLLVDALHRIISVSKDIGVKVVLVDAKNENAKTFYQKYDFIQFGDQPNTLFLPIETAITALKG